MPSSASIIDNNFSNVAWKVTSFWISVLFCVNDIRSNRLSCNRKENQLRQSMAFNRKGFSHTIADNISLIAKQINKPRDTHWARQDALLQTRISRR